DYFAHWLSIGRSSTPEKLPKLFWVNWFRRDEDGSFLWPGFGENSRVLKWIIERIGGEGGATETPIGLVPTPDAIDTEGIDVDEATMAKLLSVEIESWRQELPQIEDHYRSLGDTVPSELRDQLTALEKRLAGD